MTDNQQILEKAIEKAIANGWESFTSGIKSIDYRQGMIERNILVTIHASDYDVTIMYNLEAIIFSHDFAKALWGEHLLAQAYGAGSYIWEMHLQQMVIADDPIKYLGETI